MHSWILDGFLPAITRRAGDWDAYYLKVSKKYNRDVELDLDGMYKSLCGRKSDPSFIHSGYDDSFPIDLACESFGNFEIFGFGIEIWMRSGRHVDHERVKTKGTYVLIDLILKYEYYKLRSRALYCALFFAASSLTIYICIKRLTLLKRVTNLSLVAKRRIRENKDLMQVCGNKKAIRLNSAKHQVQSNLDRKRISRWTVNFFEENPGKQNENSAKSWFWPVMAPGSIRSSLPMAKTSICLRQSDRQYPRKLISRG